ncbi:MAG: hypothetical protein N4A35_01170 [Flavobacteriales bacterium]|jgi:hypothetical protein|nr:hypothetical protein [Flavobacteriales bacterium]
MKTIAVISLTLISVFVTIQTKAQHLHLISNTHIFLEATTPHVIDPALMNDPALMGGNFSGFDDNEEFKLSLSVLLLDTTEIYKIYVKAGRTQGGNDLFDSYFEYDNYTPADGLSYAREKKQLTLGLGNYTNLRNIYTEVYIENTSGATTQYVLNHINQ